MEAMNVAESSASIPCPDDKVLPIASLGRRWNSHPRVASERVKQHGLRVIRFNARSFGVNLSEVLRLEQELSQ
jgi:hypothetical protein